MSIQLLANSNVKLPEELSHISIEYGYTNAYKSEVLKHYLPETSPTAKRLKVLDKLINYINPINNNDKKVINEIAKKVLFLEKELDTDFTKDLKIQSNVNSGLNSKFKAIAGVLLPEEHPLQRSICSEISYMYPNTKQIVIGTKEFDLDRIDIKKSLVISTYVTLKQSSLEEVVSFTLLHEVSHILENYNNAKYGMKIDKCHDLLKVLKVLNNDIENYDSITSKSNKPIFLHNEFGIDKQVVLNLYTLYGEIYIDILIHGRIKEKKLANDILGKTNINDHYTAYGLKFLKEELNKYNSEKFTLKEMHELTQETVSHCILKTLKEYVEKEKFKNQLNTLFNLTIDNGTIKLTKEYNCIKNHKNTTNSKNMKLK